MEKLKKHHPRRSARANYGFTLIEIMVTIAIIAIFAGVSLANYSVKGRSALVADVKKFAIALEHAQEETQITGETIGLGALDGGYRFLRMNDTGEWAPMPGNREGLEGEEPGFTVEMDGIHEEGTIADGPILVFAAGWRLEIFRISIARGDDKVYLVSDIFGRVTIEDVES